MPSLQRWRFVLSIGEQRTAPTIGHSATDIPPEPPPPFPPEPPPPFPPAPLPPAPPPPAPLPPEPPPPEPAPAPPASPPAPAPAAVGCVPELPLSPPAPAASVPPEPAPAPALEPARSHEAPAFPPAPAALPPLPASGCPLLPAAPRPLALTFPTCVPSQTPGFPGSSTHLVPCLQAADNTMHDARDTNARVRSKTFGDINKPIPPNEIHFAQHAQNLPASYSCPRPVVNALGTGGVKRCAYRASGSTPRRGSRPSRVVETRRRGRSAST